jgi:predicted porin
MAGSGLVTAGESTKNWAGLTGVNSRDYTTWNVGTQFGYAGFTVGGNYTDAGSLNTLAGQNNDQTAWSAGLGYKFDRASFAGSYLEAQGYNNSSVTGSVYSDSYEAYGFGAGYSLFDGMTTSVDATFFKQEQTAGLDTEGHVVILSNRVAF